MQWEANPIIKSIGYDMSEQCSDGSDEHIPVGLSRHKSGKWRVELFIYGVKTYFALLPFDQAVARLREVEAQYPNRRLRRTGCVYYKGRTWRAILRGKYLGSFPSKYYAEKAITEALNEEARYA